MAPGGESGNLEEEDDDDEDEGGGKMELKWDAWVRSTHLGGGAPVATEVRQVVIGAAAKR